MYDVVPMAERAHGRESAVHDGVETLAGHSRQPDQAHAAMLGVARRHVVGSAVHGDVVATGRQPAADLLYVVLDAAEGRRHAAGADEGDAHQRGKDPPARAAASA